MGLRPTAVSPAVRGVGACTAGLLYLVPAPARIFLPSTAGVLVGVAVCRRILVAIGAGGGANRTVGVGVMRRVYRRAVF